MSAVAHRETAPAERFDYSAVDKPTASEARALAERVRSFEQRTVAEAIALGDQLSKMKERLGHGHFLPWLTAEVGERTVRTAQRWMELARTLAPKYDIVSYLPATAIYALARAPESARNEIVAKIEAGERPEPWRVKREVARATSDAREAAKEAKLTPEERKKRATKATRERTVQERMQAERAAELRIELEDKLADLDRAAQAADIILSALGDGAVDLQPLLDRYRSEDTLTRELKDRLGARDPQRATQDRQRWRYRSVLAGRLVAPKWLQFDSTEWDDDKYEDRKAFF